MMTLLCIFKKHHETAYNTIINDAENSIPFIINRTFITRRQAFKPTTFIAPKTILILQLIDNKAICDYFIQTLLLPLYPENVSNTTTSILRHASSNFMFLVEIFKLELFLRSNDIAVTKKVEKLYYELIDKFIGDPKEKYMPNIDNFLNYLLEKGVDKQVISTFHTSYIAFILSNKICQEINTFKKRITHFIAAFFESIEHLGIFNVIEVPMLIGNKNFSKSFVVLKNEVLNEIREMHKIKVIEQSWPSLVPLND